MEWINDFPVRYAHRPRCYPHPPESKTTASSLSPRSRNSFRGRETLIASATASEDTFVQHYPVQQFTTTVHYDLTTTDHDDNYSTANLLFDWDLHDDETDNDST